MKSYASRYITPEKAASMVKSGDWVDYGYCLGHPYSIDKALAARAEELHDVSIRGGTAFRPLEVVECDPLNRHFTFYSWHQSEYDRSVADRGMGCYIPSFFRAMAQVYRKYLHVDIAFISVTPMDKDGYFNFSLTNAANHAIIDTAKIVVLETNSRLPPIGGHENAVHISQVDFVVEGESPPPPIVNSVPPTETDIQIARHIIGELTDGSVIQLGIGALPSAIGRMIAESDLKDIGGHTEFLVDSYRLMSQAGKLNTRRKNSHTVKTDFTFAAGGKEFYDWAWDNPTLTALPVEYVNDPHVIAQNEHMVSINSCINVDILGQVASESVGARQISGTGGQLDFALGACLCPTGKSFLCCHSTYRDKKTGELSSRIVPTFSPHTVVTTPRCTAHHIVTEWGIARIGGQSLWERTERIISVAHPMFREELFRIAEKNNIWRRTNKKF